MNDKLKTTLLILEGIAKASVPGAAQADDAVRAIVSHHGDTDDAVLDAVEGAIKAVEAIKGQDIADEVKFRASCMLAEAAIKGIRDSLKVTAPATSPQGDGAGV